MELRDYIEIGSEKAGSLTALGKKLDLSQPNMSHAKAMKKALPIDAAMKLADYIGADLRSVIAANELVTEKKEEKKNYWMQFVKGANAAIMILALSVTTFVTAPEKAFANQRLETQNFTVYKLYEIAKALFKMATSFASALWRALQGCAGVRNRRSVCNASSDAPALGF